VTGEPMPTGVSMDQSESAELTSSVGVGKLTFPRQPYETVAFACALLVRQIVIQSTVVDELARR